MGIGQIRGYSGCKNTLLGLVPVRVSYAVRLGYSQLYEFMSPTGDCRPIFLCK